MIQLLKKWRWQLRQRALRRLQNKYPNLNRDFTSDQLERAIYGKVLSIPNDFKSRQ